MLGYRPYRGRNRQEIKERILNIQALIKNDQKPGDWSNQSVVFINQLLERKKENRLGAKGINEIKEHPWLKDFDWKNLYLQNLQSPLIFQRKNDNYLIKGELLNEYDNLGPEGIDKILFSFISVINLNDAKESVLVG